MSQSRRRFLGTLAGGAGAAMFGVDARGTPQVVSTLDWTATMQP